MRVNAVKTFRCVQIENGYLRSLLLCEVEHEFRGQERLMMKMS